VSPDPSLERPTAHYFDRGITEQLFKLGARISRQKINKKITPWGPGGGPPHFCSPQFLFFCDLKAHAKFQNPTITPSGRKVTQGERREKEKKRR
jgi:hypothetical protein